MVEGAVIDIARERDQALHRLQVVAAELRAHEQAVRAGIGSPRRPAGEDLRRHLRHASGRGGEGNTSTVRRGLEPITPVGANRNQRGRGL